MPALSSELRKDLATAVKNARAIGEEGAEAALVALEVGDKEARVGMPDDQRNLRKRLRAHGRQLGDVRQANGTQSTTRLKREIAYQQWHRMLFGRFLAENKLLLHPELEVALSIKECRNLAEDEGRDLWEMIGSFAQGCLPQIFRQYDPALAVKLAPEHLLDLEATLSDLPDSVFTADDSLGWVYQYWQADEKKRVKDREVPIGANELPAVTQLFTEHYMVQFLLHNTLGAWHAAKVLDAKPELAENAKSEQELRDAVALPDYTWDYLRFVRDCDEHPWRPAAGTFSEWPRLARELKILDPCCGSGHFLVELFTILLSLRVNEEDRTRLELIREVLRHNLSGLELDPRCTQIAAFALALAAWKAAGQVIPDLHANVACSGISVGDDKQAWLKLAGTDPKLREAIHRLYDLFAQATLLGSLINPLRATGDIFSAGFSQVRQLLEVAVANADGDLQVEAGIAAVNAAETLSILTDCYHLVSTNVPYLGSSDQVLDLKSYCEQFHPAAKDDLATCFVERSLDWCLPGGTSALVTTQNWLFLKSYKALRGKLLRSKRWNLLARMGEHAFESSAAAGAFAAMMILTKTKPTSKDILTAIDVSAYRGQAPIYAREKALLLKGSQGALRSFVLHPQAEQLKNPDQRITTTPVPTGTKLGQYVDFAEGLSRGDSSRFDLYFWELPSIADGWQPLATSPKIGVPFDGRESIFQWEDGKGALAQLPSARIQGQPCWGRDGVHAGRTGRLRTTLSVGEIHAQNCVAVVPKNPDHLTAIAAFITSVEYVQEVRKLNDKIIIPTGVVGQVAFDLEFWLDVASKRYPAGLPEPQSNDPKQWLFHGHPAGIVASGPASNSSYAVGDPIGTDRHPSLVCRKPNPADILQVAVCRLVGYRWPAEFDAEMRLDDAQRAWVDGCTKLWDHGDSDGIVCFDRIRGEDSAEERITKLLRDSFAEQWENNTIRAMLKATGTKTTSIDAWLRKDFFSQHNKLFQNRPFCLHIWDGLPDGFNALVNYHKLAGPDGEGLRTLQTLAFSYLNDWIDRQRSAANSGEDGADERLACSLELQEQLKNIIEGEPNYDVFVRWKPLHQQPIGWEPDINDGIRINIRPFMKAELRRGKKGAGILRAKPNIHWLKDQGKEPRLPKEDFPWFWDWDGETDDFQGTKKFDANRWNDLHYTREFKQAARDRHEGKA